MLLIVLILISITTMNSGDMPSVGDNSAYSIHSHHFIQYAHLLPDHLYSHPEVIESSEEIRLLQPVAMAKYSRSNTTFQIYNESHYNTLPIPFAVPLGLSPPLQL